MSVSLSTARRGKADHVVKAVVRKAGRQHDVEALTNKRAAAAAQRRRGREIILRWVSEETPHLAFVSVGGQPVAVLCTTSARGASRSVKTTSLNHH